MDEFFQPGDGRWERLATLRNTLQHTALSALWHEMKAERFAYYRLMAPSDSIVWVGLTDHAAAPDEPFYAMNVGQRFYIHVSDSALCHQYYARLVANGLETDWLTVPSSASIIKEARSIQESHVKYGYQLLESDEIRKVILSTLA